MQSAAGCPKLKAWKQYEACEGVPADLARIPPTGAPPHSNPKPGNIQNEKSIFLIDSQHRPL
jgi:hypothetical protein